MIVEPDEIAKAVEHIVAQGQPRFHRSLVQTRRVETEEEKEEEDGIEGPFPQGGRRDI